MDITLLKNIFGTLAVIVIVTKGFLYWRTMRGINKMPNKSTDELKSIITKEGNTLNYGAALKELRDRNENYEDALPNLVDLATSSKKGARIFGWMLIREYFPQIEQEIEFNYKKPTDESISRLKSLKYEQ